MGDLTSDDFPVHRPVATRWRDNDAYGHLNNAVYYELFDNAIDRWLTEATGTDWAGAPWLAVVAESGCRYLSEVRYPDPLVVGLAVTRVGTSSVTLRLGVFTPGGPVAAVGHWVQVFVDRDTRRPTPVPARIRTVLEAALV
ncbi:MAG: acyl-CoA thioesterase [Nocardioides sp.]|uniref:acyl-CoA thioesterase n=1 Tax=Nocardioides sp. TaxID=35761 RepID=UPI003F006015